VTWQTAWQLAKDVLLTGTGLAIIVMQIFARQPSDVLLVVGLALTVPSAAGHAASILSGPGVTPPSESSPQHGAQQAPTPPSPPPG
jgi:hypothetical protein